MDKAGWLLAAGCWPLAAGRWLLAAGCWPLAAGRWLLAAGRWPLAAGCWLLAAGLLAADPAVDLSASPSQIAVGETVQVTVTYRWPHGWTVDAEPDPAAAFRSQFVTAAPPAARSSTAEEERRTFRYTVAATRSGAWLLPRPTLTVRGPQGPSTVTAPEVIVQVGTESAPPNLPAARPLLLRPPTPLPASRLWWWIGGGAALLLGLAALWWLRRRQAIASGPTPWQVFEGELSGARSAADGKAAGAAISLAVRRYAGRLWGFDGPGLTTREMGAVLRRLRAGRITDDESRDLLRLLARLDDLRWNVSDAPTEAMHDLVTLAHTWADGVQKRLDAEVAERAKAKTKAASP